jgi:hypothetical protein
VALFGRKTPIKDGLTVVPQFARVAVGKQPGSFPPLEVSWTKDLDPVPSASEQQVIRILGSGQVLAARGRDGGPSRPADMGRPFTVATGMIDVLVTTARIVVLVQGGDTALGEVDIHAGSMLVVATPLRNIDYLSVKRSWLDLEDTANGALIRLREILGVDRGSGLSDVGTGMAEVAVDLKAALPSLR